MATAAYRKPVASRKISLSASTRRYDRYVRSWWATVGSRARTRPKEATPAVTVMAGESRLAARPGSTAQATAAANGTISSASTTPSTGYPRSLVRSAVDSDSALTWWARISMPNTTTATSRSNRNAVSRISGSPDATTSAASEIAFSSVKNPMAWDATSRRTIIRPNETSTIAPARDSARAGAAGPWILSAPKQKNPTAASTIPASTEDAGLSVWLPATPGASSPSCDSVRPSSRRMTSGTATTLSAADSAASAYRSG